VKSLDKLAQRICLALLLLPVAWVALVVLSLFWDSMAMERFYRNRPILQAMRMAQEDDHASVESAAAAEALLRHVVAGTDAETTIAVLAGEGFRCAKHPPSSGAPVACGLQVSGPFGYTNWTIDLQFDDAALLTGAKVARWNISL
jgi:uncharacterized protein (DUF2147 family)